MNMHAPEKKPMVRKLRCAVYTRKSSEEGLDMVFNSLDAQREACEAYVSTRRSRKLPFVDGHGDQRRLNRYSAARQFWGGQGPDV